MPSKIRFAPASRRGGDKVRKMWRWVGLFHPAPHFSEAYHFAALAVERVIYQNHRQEHALAEAGWETEGMRDELIRPQVNAGPLRAADTVFVVVRGLGAGADIQGGRAERQVVIGSGRAGEERVGADVARAGAGLLAVVGGAGVIVPRVIVRAGDAAGRGV